jgi:sulfite exporter TauE/SafE
MNAYSQILSIGILWITIHCAGMCGPIIAGVTSSPGSKTPFGKRIIRVLAYQSGRAVTYAALGMAAGLVGAVFETTIRSFANAAGLVLSAALVLMGIAQLPAVHRRIPTLNRGSGQSIAAQLMKVIRAAREMHDIPRLFVTGMMLGLLPCMLMFWVLSIAASTASPFHGAGVMVLLVVMTTPTLIFAGVLAQLPIRKYGEQLVPLSLIVSGAWMGMVALAANGWIDHVHLQFKLGGEGYVFMLW